MPIMDGATATGKIFEFVESMLIFDYKPVVIAVTAYVDPQSTLRCKEEGMEEVIHKPAGVENIQEVMQKHCPYVWELFSKK
eukprot:CAMPEP_0170486698 /NCGR_PEP_ID=MMETSP0208-20121228/5651_1 /TAXON_ID=197538 /ORGANISM="Strombidium inclinatum, Strain S3" /LENGTH=80 /DNA_ID=CAMNT_0010760713 /DNA_START=134 /DNA_END=376 /DNA_ORIENTATION=-